jgi:hypothetical protein
MTYVLAFYEIDRAYGGPEEGGWWFDTGRLERIFKVCKSKDQAYAFARRANRLLEVLQRNGRCVNSVIYDGGRYSAGVFENYAPPYYPESKPHYE